MRSKKDVLMLKNLILSETKHPVPVISKIEKPQAISKLESILKVSDGLMVARGGPRLGNTNRGSASESKNNG